MRRRERIGDIAIGQQTNILEHVTGAYPAHPVFKPMAGKLVSDGQRDPHKNHEDNARLPLPPENPQPQGQQHVGEIFEVGHERHKPVEKEILSLPIDEMKHKNIRSPNKGDHENRLPTFSAENSLSRK
jgi:hypothetical protein